MYVYAWWRCAEYLPDARLHLRVLTEADLTEFPGGYRIFALRGAVIARLGMMCLDVVLSSDELVGQQTPYPAGTLLFCYLNVSEFVKRHASALRGHAQCGQLRDLLLACLQEEENVTIHPLEEELRGSRYLCARSCREMLLHLDEGGAHILQRERQESVAYSVLRHLGSGYDACFTRLIEASSHDVLPLLDTTLSLADDALIAILYYWMEETHAWYSLLIARVYARMFSLGPIGVAEARELCEQMLMALSALPNSPDRRQHEVVYRAITLRLDGDTQPVPELPVSVSTLQHTHALAISLLQRARKENESTWIMEALSDRRGWRDTTRYQLDDQAYSMGTHKYFLYVFPAVRLALIAVGRRYGLDDPAAQFMMERVQVNRLMEEHWRVFHEDIPTDSSQLQKALAAFKEQMELTPRDERLWQARGHLLLRLGRLEEAKESLLHSLSMSSCSQGTRADAHYNLACAYARMKREDDCRRTLQEWIQLRPLNQFYRDWLVRDPDLEEVRGRAWFQAFQGQE